MTFEVFSRLLSSWTIPTIFLFIVIYGYLKKVKVYDAFVDGAGEGLRVAVQIMPYLVVILVAIALFRTSGAMEILASKIIGLIIPSSLVHPDIVLLALIKPLSGGAARGVMLDIFQTHGVDSRIGYMASVIQGSTETTFYVLAVYYGAVNIKNTRHTLPCGLVGEFTGVVVAIVLSYAMWHEPETKAVPAAGTASAPSVQKATTSTTALDLVTTR